MKVEGYANSLIDVVKTYGINDALRHEVEVTVRLLKAADAVVSLATDIELAESNPNKWFVMFSEAQEAYEAAKREEGLE